MSGIGLTPFDAASASKSKNRRGQRKDKRVRSRQHRAEPSVVTFDIPTPKISRLIYWVIALAIAIAVGGLIWARGTGADVGKLTTAFISSNFGSKQQKAVPTFDTLAPEDSNSTTKGLAYDQQKSLASYPDKIAGVDIIVSQQTLPDSFKKHPQQEVEALAKSFNANQVIATADTQAFYGVSNDGSIVTLFTKKDLLVFIRAKKAVEKEALANYITKLR